MIKCEACRVLYNFLLNEFNSFNNTGGQILDSIHHILKLIKNALLV